MTVDVLNVGRGEIRNTKKILRPTKLKQIDYDVSLEVSFVFDGESRFCTYYKCDDFPDLLRERYFSFDFSTFDSHIQTKTSLGKVKYILDTWWVDDLKKESYQIFFPKSFFDDINIVEYRDCVQYVLDKVCYNGLY